MGSMWTRNGKPPFLPGRQPVLVLCSLYSLVQCAGFRNVTPGFSPHHTTQVQLGGDPSFVFNGAAIHIYNCLGHRDFVGKNVVGQGPPFPGRATKQITIMVDGPAWKGPVQSHTGTEPVYVKFRGGQHTAMLEQKPFSRSSPTHRIIFYIFLLIMARTQQINLISGTSSATAFQFSAKWTHRCFFFLGSLAGQTRPDDAS